MSRRTRRAHVALLLLGVALLGTNCSRDENTLPEGGPQPVASFTPVPTDEGSALLVYRMVADKYTPDFVSTSYAEIPLVIWVDQQELKAEAKMVGAQTTTQDTQIAGGDQGNLCFVQFEMPVTYEVNGVFVPKECAFYIGITMKADVGRTERTGDCSVPLQDTYPVETLRIDPPPGTSKAPYEGMHFVPGSLLPVTLPHGDVDITIQLKNVVVPEDTGCQW